MPQAEAFGKIIDEERQGTEKEFKGICGTPQDL